MGWTIGVASDSGKATAVQVNSTNGGVILFPGAGSGTTNVSLAAHDYEFLAMRYDGSNFRVTEVTPATATLMGMSGSDFSLNRFNFPNTSTYVAQSSDGGNVLSSYNTNTGLIVTLPVTSTIYQGWTMGFMTDNGRPLTVQVNGNALEKILIPTQGGLPNSSITLGTGNYEFVELKFDGANYRIVASTPQTINAYGGLISQGTPVSSSTPCNLGQLQADANYVYICTAPNAWKRAPLSPF